LIIYCVDEPVYPARGCVEKKCYSSASLNCNLLLRLCICCLLLDGIALNLKTDITLNALRWNSNLAGWAAISWIWRLILRWMRWDETLIWLVELRFHESEDWYISRRWRWDQRGDWRVHGLFLVAVSEPTEQLIHELMDHHGWDINIQFI